MSILDFILGLFTYTAVKNTPPRKTASQAKQDSHPREHIDPGVHDLDLDEAGYDAACFEGHEDRYDNYDFHYDNYDSGYDDFDHGDY